MTEEKAKKTTQFNRDFVDWQGINMNDLAAESGDPNVSQIAYDVYPEYRAMEEAHNGDRDAWIDIGEPILEEYLYSGFLRINHFTESDLIKRVGIMGISDFRKQLIEQFKAKHPVAWERECRKMYAESKRQNLLDAKRNTMASYVHDSGFQSIMVAHSVKDRPREDDMLTDESGLSPSGRQAMRLIYEFRDRGYTQFYITSASNAAQGTGKTNFMAYCIELAIAQYGITDSLAVYNPMNFGSIYKRQYGYQTFPEIFIDEPHGRSVANTIIERTLRRERTGLRDAMFYSFVAMGEQGGGAATGRNITEMMSTFQVLRHFGIVLVGSGIMEYPPRVLDKFIQGRILMSMKHGDTMDPDRVGRRSAIFTASFQKKIPDPNKLVYETFYTMRRVPKVSSRLYSGDKGLGLDTTTYDAFSIPDMLRVSGYTDEEFEKDPDKFVERFSEYAMDYCEGNGIDVSKWTKQQPSNAPARIMPKNAGVDENEEDVLD